MKESLVYFWLLLLWGTLFFISFIVGDLGKRVTILEVQVHQLSH